MNKDPQYADYLSLLTHLLWCYDHRQVSGENRAKENNGAWLVRSGWAEVHHNKQVVRAQPGEWLIVWPGPRLQRFAPNTELLSVSFEARWPDGSHLLEDGLSVVVCADEFPELEERAAPMVNLMARILPDKLWDVRRRPVNCIDFLELQAYLTGWLAALVEVLQSVGVQSSRSEPIDDRVLRAVRRLEALPYHESLDLEALANVVGISRVHLSRLFRQYLDMTPHAYRDRLRMEYACRRLQMPDTRPLEVAYELGFKYLSHFSRWFKTHTGTSPRNYR